jgi:hypothetical protein
MLAMQLVSEHQQLEMMEQLMLEPSISLVILESEIIDTDKQEHDSKQDSKLFVDIGLGHITFQLTF